MRMFKICPSTIGPASTGCEAVTSLVVVIETFPVEPTVEPIVRPVKVSVTAVLALITIIAVVITI